MCSPFFMSKRVKFLMAGAVGSQLPSAMQAVRARIIARMALVLYGSDCITVWTFLSQIAVLDK